MLVQFPREKFQTYKLPENVSIDFSVSPKSGEEFARAVEMYRAAIEQDLKYVKFKLVNKSGMFKNRDVLVLQGDDLTFHEVAPRRTGWFKPKEDLHLLLARAIKMLAPLRDFLPERLKERVHTADVVQFPEKQ